MAQSINIPAKGAPPRRATLQGTALLLLLVPLAMMLSYLLAIQANAPSPEAAASLTALVCALGAGAILSGLSRRDSFPHARLGLCNVITLTRAAGIAALAGLLVTPLATPGWGLSLFALALLLLDALDGWAARRADLQSPFGARLDVETDVAFALTLAAVAVAMGQAGAWFLALGLLRPAFLLAARLWPALRAPLPEAMWRKRMAGLQMVVQVALISPLLAPPASTLLAAALLAAMLASFAIDIRWLARQAHRA